MKSRDLSLKSRLFTYGLMRDNRARRERHARAGGLMPPFPMMRYKSERNARPPVRVAGDHKIARFSFGLMAEHDGHAISETGNELMLAVTRCR